LALRFTLTKVLPAVLVYGALIVAAVCIDLILHYGKLVWVGRYLGAVGSGTILASFLYSVRKRKLISIGSPRRLLQAHEVCGWLGALMVLVHGGIHFNAVLPWVALLAMMAVVASGLTGKYLLQDARASLADRAVELQSGGLKPADVERELLWHSLLVETMKHWRRIHMPLTMVFAGLATIHIVATLLLWRW
jgi:hypothetical protein